MNSQIMLSDQTKIRLKLSVRDTEKNERTVAIARDDKSFDGVKDVFDNMSSFVYGLYLQVMEYHLENYETEDTASYRIVLSFDVDPISPNFAEINGKLNVFEVDLMYLTEDTANNALVKLAMTYYIWAKGVYQNISGPVIVNKSIRSLFNGLKLRLTSLVDNAGSHIVSENDFAKNCFDSASINDIVLAMTCTPSLEKAQNHMRTNYDRQSYNATIVHDSDDYYYDFQSVQKSLEKSFGREMKNNYYFRANPVMNEDFKRSLRENDVDMNALSDYIGHRVERLDRLEENKWRR